MLGGEKETVAYLDPIWKTIAPGRAASRARPHAPALFDGEEAISLRSAGAGHFAKGAQRIEYGSCKPNAEGFDIMKNANSPSFRRGRARSAARRGREVWRRGSVVSSWLLDLMADALGEDGTLSGYLGTVETLAKGAGRRVEEAVEADVLVGAYRAVPLAPRAPRSRKVLSAMRNQVRRARRAREKS